MHAERTDRTSSVVDTEHGKKEQRNECEWCKADSRSEFSNQKKKREREEKLKEQEAKEKNRAIV